MEETSHERNTGLFPSMKNRKEEFVPLLIEHLTTVEDKFEKYFLLLTTEQ